MRNGRARLADAPRVRRIRGDIEAGLAGVPLGDLSPPRRRLPRFAVHLLLDESRHVTGAVFSVDGGRTAG